ncbi:hypothetical protein SAMN06297280_3459 [Arsukibacterium tuosuense]|uniref:Uncharacterized protein n=1 Tax=Arsukibacterium tuosuense TaxID=1323745 RepID=A0A285JH13_9GAMM|nr:hypothetical protein [Arsukibacterium tuosuense]SNY58666.1 hypothetical protein SAMN06297280_3459 [Arsukibacterium tuosuense]
MKITAIAQNYSTPAGNKSTAKVENDGSQITSDNMATDAAKLNLRDVSISEINSLIKSGNSALLDVLPFVPPHILEQKGYDPALVGEHRINLLGQGEQRISFQQSIGKNTTLLEQTLEKLKKIDGSNLPQKIDATA